MKNQIFLKIDIEGLLNNDRKGAKRQVQIANRAIELLSNKSVSDFSFETLAKKCRVTRSLIYRYFPDFESLITFLSVLIRHRYQGFVLQAMQSEKPSRRMFEAYLNSALDWVEMFPNDAYVWLVYFHQCTVTQNLAEHNSKITDMGRQRIFQILKAAHESSDSKITAKNMDSVARLVQFLITGYLVARATESRSQAEWKVLKASVIKTCLGFLD